MESPGPQQTSGAYSPILTAGGDVSFVAHYTIREGVFFEPSLRDAQPPQFEGPAIASELLDRWSQTRVLILAGPGMPDKARLARHLAWRLQRKLLAHDPAVQVKQWQPTNELLRLDAALSREREGTVFLFDELQPHNIRHDLRLFVEQVRRHEHFALVTTDRAPANWETNDNDPCWRELELRVVFTPDYLTRQLLRNLEAARDRLPANALPPAVGPHTILAGDRSLHSIATELGTPSLIESFVTSLRSELFPLSEGSVRRLVERQSADTSSLGPWLRALGTRQQILATGLLIFAGLFDDQVFAALEGLVSSTWRDFEPALKHFDYHELASVSGYFSGTDGDPGTSLVKLRSGGNEQSLLPAMWSLHRRRLLASLPFLVDLVKASARGSRDPQFSILKRQEPTWPQQGAADGAAGQQQPPMQPEIRVSRWLDYGPERDLYGSAGRRSLIQQVVGETLSRLAWLAPENLERALLDLAEDDRAEVQGVAAQALARWRLDHEEAGATRLLATLNEWRDEAFWRERARRGRHLGEAEAKRLAAVRATVALAICYAALYDPPDQLDERLIKISLAFLEDSEPTVRDRFRRFTLPLLVTLHFGQLEEALRTSALRHEDLIDSVASGLATAHSYRPKEVELLLDRWLQVQRRSDAAGRGGLPAHLLATVALAYGGLRCEAGGDKLTRADVFSRLRALVGSQSHPLVRKSVARAMLLQADENFAETGPLMQILVEEFRLTERAMLVELLLSAYLRQRAQLKEGDEVVTLEGVRFSIWTHRSRPLTGVELVLHQWLQNGEHPTAQQVALHVLAAAVDSPLEVKERERAWQHYQTVGRAATAAAPAAASPSADWPMRPTPALGRAAIWLATRGEKNWRRILHALLPEFLVHDQAAAGKAPPTATLRYRWKHMADEHVRRLEQYLGAAVGWYRARFLWVAGLGVLGLFGLAFALSLVSAIAARP